MDSDNTNQNPHKGGLTQTNEASEDTAKAQRQAALNITRGQVERIYQGNSGYNTPHTTPISVPSRSESNMDQRELSNPISSNAETINVSAKEIQPPILKKQKIIQPLIDSEKPSQVGAIDYKPNPESVKKAIRNNSSDQQSQQWKLYHTAWQNYYQKYYEGYYTAAVKNSTKNSPNNTVNQEESPENQKATALYKLKKDISNKAREKGGKFRRSRHFVPVISAIIVVLVFVFLQYNRLFIANVQAYVSPGNSTPQDTIYSPSASIKVSNDPKLIIPKINVDVPVIYGVGSDQQSQLDAMAKGVAHFSIPGANSVPGQIGNTVLSGHSSNDLFDSGDYKFIFAQLNRLNENDIIYVNYQGVRYTYNITGKKVVLPTDVQSLIYSTDKPILTLITCTPLGTAEKRLLVIAEQISPDPSNAEANSSSSGSDSNSSTTEMPSNSKTFFEKLFSWDWS